MDSTQKLLADIQKIKKHYRAEHSQYSGPEVCSQVAQLFERTNRHVCSLAAAYAQYWQEAYILTSATPQEEPTEPHAQVLAAMQSLLDDDVANTQVLTQADWNELCAITSAEAPDLDIEILNSLMAVFVEKQALR